MVSRLHIIMVLHLQQELIAMTQTQSADPNPMQRSLVAMLHTWTRCISWTVLLSALLAVLFALALDGCTAVQAKARTGLAQAAADSRQTTLAR